MPAVAQQSLPQPATDPERQLRAFVGQFTHDPLGFVLACFPWGQAGTPLADRDGPDEWQREHLSTIGAELRAGKMVQEAISSGHGIGKSADACWLILWAMSTHEDCRGVVTANTENQLTTKTWAELAKWHRMLICRHWFKYNATSLHSVEPSHEKTWRIDAIAWSENNTEAFAGLHNEGKRILVLFDEASAIADPIWEVTEGALTDANTEILWIVRGNPTRNAGRFRECFGRNAHRWRTRQIDSRSVKITNKAKLQQWVDDYGEDSDFVRVRVRGVFPRAGSMQFQPSDTVLEAMKREPPDPLTQEHEGIAIGVDVARYGDDEAVVATRRGRDARTLPWLCMREVDTMTLAGRVAELYHNMRVKFPGVPIMIFVDEGGMGVAVIDRLRQLGVPCVGVNFGGKPTGMMIEGEHVKAKNRATEMACARREWLKHGCIPNDPTLEQQLIDREYSYDGTTNAIILESKEHMKQVRNLSSPDRGDALDLTFAAPILPADMMFGPSTVYETDYATFG
jgi:hypothetical protein